MYYGSFVSKDRKQYSEYFFFIRASFPCQMVSFSHYPGQLLKRFLFLSFCSETCKTPVVEAGRGPPDSPSPLLSEERIKGNVFFEGRSGEVVPAPACLLPLVSAPVSGLLSDVDSRPPFSVLMKPGTTVTHRGPLPAACKSGSIT